MSHYTDADVQAGGDAVLEHGAYDPELASTGHLCITRDVLDAVAPAIAARALREFRDSLHDRRDVFKVWADPRAAIRAVEIDLSATASEIERGA